MKGRLRGSAGTGRNYVRFAKFAFIGVIVLTLIAFISVPLLAFTLPSPDKIVRREGFSTKILDRDGEVLYDIYSDKNRTQVEFEQIPAYLRQATVAVEDKNFYRHSGFDLTAYPRAVFNIMFKGKLQGGSTLTQQLVKNVLLTSERTVTRKIKEFVLAVQIESRFSKDEILLMYLNEAPYGGTAWGVESASEIYFGKSVSELNLLEAAFLAGLPQRPSAYSPYSSTPEAYVERTKGVLRRMREDGYITREQEEEVVGQVADLEFQPRGASFRAPHFVQYVQTQLEEKYGERLVQQGGLEVTTTLDLELQETAQKIVSEEITNSAGLGIGNGAAVVMDSHTGEVLAMVGSKDFNAEDYDGQVNVTLALRQPGSALKPFVYLTGLQKGYTAATLFEDVSTSFPGGASLPEYRPENYDGKYRGPIQMRYALANSINVPAVKMVAMVGVDEVLETAYNVGFDSLEPTGELLSRVGLSVALGGGEVRLLDLAEGYGVLLNGGHQIEPVSVLKVVDHDGKVLEEAKLKDGGKRIVEPEHAYILTDILSDNEARTLVFGPNSLLRIAGRQIAVKTGTTNDKRDNWAIGGDPNIVVGAWVGNNDNSAMTNVASGVSGATPIWRRILLEALDGRPNESFERPGGIVSVQVDKLSGYRAHDGFPERTELFVKGTELAEDPVHVLVKLCKGEERLATPSQVAANDFIEREFVLLKAEDPTAAPGAENKWQRGVLEWIDSLPADQQGLYRSPTEYCGGGNLAPLNVEFSEPRDRDSDLNSEFKIKFRVDSVNKIKEMRLEIDGALVRTFSGPPYEYDADLPTGVHTIVATAEDEKGNKSDRRITVGVGVPWNNED
jgi:1A family penicillin-binding protein